MDSIQCGYCTHDVPIGSRCCPHCARPALFWNVKEAEDPAERQELQARYEQALENAAQRGAEAIVVDFETAVVSSKVVITRPLEELERLSSSGKELYSTFYKLIKADLRLPAGNKWDRLRRVADEGLFPGYKEEIRFGALSLNGRGLPSYGDASFVLREDMISHRATVFEENSSLFMKFHNYEPPRGFRATWAERAKLCVAKLARTLDHVTTSDQFIELLLCSGERPEKDHFIEVHIWGPLSAYAFERVALFPEAQCRPSRRKALQERLAAFGVELEPLE